MTPALPTHIGLVEFSEHEAWVAVRVHAISSPSCRRPAAFGSRVQALAGQTTANGPAGAQPEARHRSALS
jgi:hypothetical protein